MVSTYTSAFQAYLEDHFIKKEPKNLYEPIRYILGIGGKRIRPSLTLMACELFGTPYEKALQAALSIEMFHNFSLIHDDIMDKAPLRRGHQTVHEKWDINTGILSGDALLIMASQLLNAYDSTTYKQLNTLFHKTALEVCEGQQYDFDFEASFEVSVDDYLEMIRLKTAVLLAASLQFGAIIAEATEADMEAIYTFGLNLGMAFQLQDDYLDVFASAHFGKQKAGDIISNKKTFLVLKTLDLAQAEEVQVIRDWYAIQEASEQKISEVSALFKKYEVDKLIQDKIAYYTQLGVAQIDNLRLGKQQKSQLKEFATLLMQRKI